MSVESKRRQTGFVFTSSLLVSGGGFAILGSLPSAAGSFQGVQCAAGALALFVGLYLLMEAHG